MPVTSFSGSMSISGATFSALVETSCSNDGSICAPLFVSSSFVSVRSLSALMFRVKPFVNRERSAEFQKEWCLMVETTRTRRQKEKKRERHLTGNANLSLSACLGSYA